MEHSTEILYNKTEVFCSAVHRFGSDALLLARFAEPKRLQRAADLCSGCGIVSLEWHDRGHRGPCAAIELQPDAAPWLFLVEAQKNRKTGLRIEPDVLLSTGAALYGKQ